MSFLGRKEIQENRYDGEGLRAGLAVNGRESTFLYEAGNLYAESDEAGAEISRYIRGNGLAGLEYRGKLYGAHRDEQLSTGWVTGEAGVPESVYEYDALLRQSSAFLNGWYQCVAFACLLITPIV